MAEKLKGITIEIGGDTVGLESALKDVNSKASALQTELRQVDKLLKLDPTNTALLAQKQDLLSQAVGTTKDKLEQLRTAQAQVNEQFAKGEINEAQYRALQREIVSTEQSLERLESQAIKSNATLSKDDAVKNLKHIGEAAGLAAGAVGVAFVGMAKAAADNADELQRQADVTGLTAERLQELQYAGNNLGVELDTITGAQAKLTKSMAAAADGTGSQADAFARLKIHVTDSNGQLRDAKTVMEEAFTALNGVGNETERDSLAMAIFGKSAMEMNPLIKAGGDELNRLAKEARDSGAVMSNEAVAGLDTFGDTMDNIKNSVLGSFGEKFGEILPKIQEFLDKLKELPAWIQENSNLLIVLGGIIGTITTLIIAYNIQQALMASGMTLWAAIAGIGTTVTTALGAAFTFLTGPIGLAVLAIMAIITAGVLLYKNWDEIIVWAKKLGDNIKTKFSEILNTIKTAWTNAKTATKETWDNIVTTIKDTLTGAIAGIMQIGKNIVEGLWNGISGAASWIKEKIQGFAAGILSSIKEALGIASPSKVMRDQVGQMIGAGIAVGIDNSLSQVEAAMGRLSGEVNLTGSVGSSSGTTNQYTFAPGSIVIPAKDLEEMQSVSDFFKRLPQVARAGGAY